MERVPRLRSALLARISRLGAKSGRAPGRSRDVSSVRDIPRPPPFSRRCIVKARFVPMTAHGARAAALHLAYIERDGVERDGSAGRLVRRGGRDARARAARGAASQRRSASSVSSCRPRTRARST